MPTSRGLVIFPNFEIHLETARLMGLTTQTIEIDELPRLIGNEIIDFGQKSIAELAVTGRYLNPTIGPVPFTPVELAELPRGDRLLRLRTSV